MTAMTQNLTQSESSTADTTKTKRAIDLRSDTVTQPTAEMRRAMAEAEVADDVYGEDPTMNRLVERTAQIFQKEAAIFVPSGTMGNQIAIRCHTQHGQEVISTPPAVRRGDFLNWSNAAATWCLVEVLRPRFRRPTPARKRASPLWHGAGS